MTKGHNNFIEYCKNCEESERGLDGERERERGGVSWVKQIQYAQI